MAVAHDEIHLTSPTRLLLGVVFRWLPWGDLGDHTNENKYHWGKPLIGEILIHGVRDPSHKSHSVLDKYPITHHFKKENMCTFLLQNGVWWDMGLVHCGICWIGLLITSGCSDHMSDNMSVTKDVATLFTVDFSLVNEPQHVNWMGWASPTVSVLTRRHLRPQLVCEVLCCEAEIGKRNFESGDREPHVVTNMCKVWWLMCIPKPLLRHKQKHEYEIYVKGDDFDISFVKYIHIIFTTLVISLIPDNFAILSL